MSKFKSPIKSILIACSRGDRTSQLKLYKEYFSFSYNICLRYAKDKKEAGLILNEAWVFIFEKIKKAIGKGQFEDWLKNMLIKAIIEFHKNSFNKKKHLTYRSIESTSNQELDFKNLNYQIILDTIQSLPLECRIVFCLAIVDNYSLSEISEILHWDLEIVKKCLEKGRAKLENSLVEKV